MKKVNDIATKIVIYIFGIVMALVIGYIFATNVFSIFKVSGESMDNTLHDGQALYVNRLPFQHYSKGDIVIANVEGVQVVKRVLAVEGDTIQMIEGRLVVNGNEVKEPYVTDEGYPIGNLKEKQTIAQGEVYLLGDNRDVSRDSRYFGTVSTRDVLGKVIKY